jgi:hypothetical protein
MRVGMGAFRDLYRSGEWITDKPEERKRAAGQPFPPAPDAK